MKNQNKKTKENVLLVLVKVKDKVKNKVKVLVVKETGVNGETGMRKKNNGSKKCLMKK